MIFSWNDKTVVSLFQSTIICILIYNENVALIVVFLILLIAGHSKYWKQELMAEIPSSVSMVCGFVKVAKVVLIYEFGRVPFFLLFLIELDFFIAFFPL
jgi:hypothetical protein